MSDARSSPTSSPTNSAPDSFESRRSTLWAASGYLVIVGVLFHRLLLGEVLSPAANLWVDAPFRSELREDFTPYLNGIQGDVWRAIEPWHIYQYRAAREGRFPLWNPHAFCGFPFHANGQSAMLSPFHWIYFAVDPKWAAGPMAALKLWLAGFATFWLGRRLSLVPLGAFLSGAAFMLCAFNVRWLLWPLASAAVWLPVLLVAFDVLIERMSWRNFAVAGLAATALQLMGHPETQFHVGVLSGLYVLVRVGLRKEKFGTKTGRVLICLAVHGMGVVGAAVSLWPFAEQLLESADWHEPRRLIARELPVEGLLGAVAPDHYGRPRAGRFYQGPQNYVEAGLYIGLMPLALASVSLVRLVIEPRRTRARPAGDAILIFGLWVLLCGIIVLSVPGIAVVMARLPLFSKADNLRLLLGVQFGGAMLAGAAWTQLTHESNRLGVWTTFSALAAVAAGIAFLLLGAEPVGIYSHRDGLFQLWTDPTVPAPLEHHSLRTLVSFLFAAVGVFWFWLWRRSLRHSAEPRSRAAAGEWPRRILSLRGRPVGLLVLLTVGDLLWVAYDFNPVVPSRVVFPDPPQEFRRLTESLGDGRLVATGEILSPNLAMVYGFRDLRGYDFPLDAYWAKLFQRLSWNPGMPLVPRHQTNPCVYPAFQSLCDKCCVRFLVTNPRGNANQSSSELAVCPLPGDSRNLHSAWIRVDRRSDAAEGAVYENPTAYPRAYFAEQVTAAALETALDAVLDLTHDFRKESFVREPIAELGEATAALASAEATIEHDAAEDVRIQTRSAAAGLLVLSDRYDAGWRVAIDGQPAEALRANCLFRGVVVPAGEHVVRWTYRPASFVWGSVISVATLGALLLIVVVQRKSSPRGGLADSAVT